MQNALEVSKQMRNGADNERSEFIHITTVRWMLKESASKLEKHDADTTDQELSIKASRQK